MAAQRTGGTAERSDCVEFSPSVIRMTSVCKHWWWLCKFLFFYFMLIISTAKSSRESVRHFEMMLVKMRAETAHSLITLRSLCDMWLHADKVSCVSDVTAPDKNAHKWLVSMKLSTVKMYVLPTLSTSPFTTGCRFCSASGVQTVTRPSSELCLSLIC